MSASRTSTTTRSETTGHAPSIELRRAVAKLSPPFAVVDRRAFDANLDDLAARADGVPIRVASKSLRSIPALERALDHEATAGVLAFTLSEAFELVERGFDDVLVAYPCTDPGPLGWMAFHPELRTRITLMIDDVAQLDLLEAEPLWASDWAAAPIRVCLDVDASFRPLEQLTKGRVHLGARRSPVRTPAEAARLAAVADARERVRVVGVMFYEAQIAGVPDGAPGLRGAAVRAMQRRSDAELRTRRGAVVRAVEQAIGRPLELVNGGGTGSLERTAADRTVTELAAGSGLFAPGLFDGYRGFRPRPAAFAVFGVARRPSPDTVTILGGGWIASGPPGADRQPRVAWPPGLRPLPSEGFGEVQTPLRGRAAAQLQPGAHVWLRHAKAGELAERVREFVVVDGDRIVDRWPTYRGEGWSFL